MFDAITALIGYAVGTAQIVALDWFNRRRLHDSHLRVLRAEIRRALSMDRKYDWDEDVPLSSHLPNPPMVSPKYADIVTTTDFRLTDEHDDDNTQQAMLQVLDGCSVLRYYTDRILEAIKDYPKETDGVRKLALRDDLKELADEYDRRHEQLREILDSALRDVNRRLRQIKFVPQLKRLRDR